MSTFRCASRAGNLNNLPLPTEDLHESWILYEVFLYDCKGTIRLVLDIGVLQRQTTTLIQRTIIGILFLGSSRTVPTTDVGVIVTNPSTMNTKRP